MRKVFVAMITYLQEHIYDSFDFLAEEKYRVTCFLLRFVRVCIRVPLGRSTCFVCFALTSLYSIG